MRAYEEPAEVEAEPVGDAREEVDGQRPLRFTAWDHVYLVSEVLDSWCQDRPWYIGREPEVIRPLWFWRVRAVRQNTAIVVLREDCGVWHVVGVED